MQLHRKFMCTAELIYQLPSMVKRYTMQIRQNVH